MSEWKEYRLGEVCTELSDGLHKAPNFKKNGDYIFVNAKNIVNGFIIDNDPTKKSTHEEYLKYASPLNDTSILYSIDGTIGNIALYRGEKCILGKGACYMNPNPQILDRMFLYYELQSPRFKSYIYKMSTGSTIKHISLKTMRGYDFSFPSLERQRRIASILSSLDDKIAVNRRICENLEAQAQALFKNWFVDFAPFKNGKFVESELGMIPEGWRVGTLSEVADLVKTSIKPQGNTLYSHYSIPAFDNNQTPSCDSGESIKSSKFAIQDSVIMLSKLNPEHKRIWFIQNVGSNAVCSTEFLPFYAKDRGQSVFVYCYLNCPQNYREIANGAKGTTNSHQRLDANAVLTRKLAYKNDVVTRFSKLVGDFMKQKDIALQENLRLATLRDTLLPKLMSGEIKI